MQKVLCLNCKNYIGSDRCFAFKNKIPNEIFIGDNNHKKPTKSQTNKLIFEKV